MSILKIVFIVLLFSFIILFHELGHFIFAKRSGIGILEFAIGMGPKVWSTKKGETEYSIRLIPIGGFVAMAGEDGAENDPEETNMDSFGDKTIWQRVQTIAAGPIFNIILTVILLAGVFTYMGTPQTELANVVKGTPAYEAGIEPGDKVVEIGGMEIKNWSDVSAAVDKSGNKKTEIVVDRDGKEKTFEITPEKSKDNRYVLGIEAKMGRNPFVAIKNAVVSTWEMSVQMVTFVVQLFTGNLPMKLTDAVGGPVAVVSVVNEASKVGVLNLIYVMAVISLNLGILNLVPFPALDGFRLLMLLIEFLRGGKKLDPEKEGFVNMLGFAALMAFIVFITHNDILKLIR